MSSIGEGHHEDALRAFLRLHVRDLGSLLPHVDELVHRASSTLNGNSAEVIDQATQIAPGIESPTISQTRESAWVAVRVLVRRAEANDIMDALYDIGARAILVSAIHAARL